MYSGEAVETGNVEEVFDEMRHPYTQALLSAIPIPNPELERNKKVQLLSGDLPSPLNPPSGCVFRTRCPKAQDDCAGVIPPLHSEGPATEVACIHV